MKGRRGFGSLGILNSENTFLPDERHPSVSYQSKSLNGAIEAFAPDFENNTSAYQAAVTNAIGAAGTTMMNTLDGVQLNALAGAITQHEGWVSGQVTYQPHQAP
jgi:hypothetical protein